MHGFIVNTVYVHQNISLDGKKVSIVRVEYGHVADDVT